MTKFKPPIGTPPAVQYFKPGELQVDISYQRSTRSHGSQRLIEQIAAKWDWRLCTPLLVASRDGGSTSSTASTAGKPPSCAATFRSCPARSATTPGSAEEAALFVAANRHRVRVNPLDMWRAAVASATRTRSTLERWSPAGLSIASSPTTTI
jgi:hypothetical protein